MIYKIGERMRDFLDLFVFIVVSSFLYFGGVFNKTIIPLALVGYEMIIANVLNFTNAKLTPLVLV